MHPTDGWHTDQESYSSPYYMWGFSLSFCAIYWYPQVVIYVVCLPNGELLSTARFDCKLEGLKKVNQDQELEKTMMCQLFFHIAQYLMVSAQKVRCILLLTSKKYSLMYLVCYTYSCIMNWAVDLNADTFISISNETHVCPTTNNITVISINDAIQYDNTLVQYLRHIHGYEEILMLYTFVCSPQ